MGSIMDCGRDDYGDRFKQPSSPTPAAAEGEAERAMPTPVCKKCGGEGWLWPHELDEPPWLHDDTKYTCDACKGDPVQSESILAPSQEGRCGEPPVPPPLTASECSSGSVSRRGEPQTNVVSLPVIPEGYERIGPLVDERGYPAGYKIIPKRPLVENPSACANCGAPLPAAERKAIPSQKMPDPAAHITALQARVAELEGERDTALTDAHDTASALNDLLDRAEREGVRARTCELAWEKDCKTAEQRVKELEGALRQLDGDSLDAIMEVVGEGDEFRVYNNGKATMRGWFIARIERILSAQSADTGTGEGGELEHAVLAPEGGPQQ